MLRRKNAIINNIQLLPERVEYKNERTKVTNRKL